MGTGRKVIAALLALALSIAAQARERPQIQFAEKVKLTTGTAQMQFDAYGRRFVLNLQSNDRVPVAGYRLWRGTLEGVPGSWVRLTEHAGASEGAIWDGRDLYAVTRYEKIDAYLGNKLAANASDTVVFRLSDSVNLLPSGYCGTGPSTDGLASNNSLVQYRNMIAELQTQLASTTRQIEISMIADSALQSSVTDPIAEMLTSYNIVDGIYAEQVGLLILPTDLRLGPVTGNPFTATDPAALLAQLTTYRNATPEVASRAIAHMFTGLELDGDTVGIARLSSACTTDAASLTESSQGFWTNALVMAHEIGHNLGAEHDGFGACAAFSPIYLMSPSLNASEQFSQCSLNAINAYIATQPTSCVTAPVFAQVELPRTTAKAIGELDVPFIVPIELYSTGTRAVNEVKLNLKIHPSLVLTASTPGVNCTPVTDGLSCDVGSIAAGATRTVELTFLPGMVGGFMTDVSVSASNNQNTRNSRQYVSIDVQSNVDTTVSVATSKSTATFGDDVDVTLTVKSLKSHTARNVRVGVYGGGLSGVSVDAPSGVTCQFDGGQTFCTLSDLPGNTTRTIVVHSKATQVGISLPGTAYVGADNDSNFSNDAAYFTMNSIVAAHDVGLEDLTTSAPVQLDMPYEYKANLRSLGLQSVSDVRVVVSLSMQDPAALNAVSSVTVGGNACTKLEINHYECLVGTMAAGEVLPFSIKGIATGLGEVRVTLYSYASINDDTSNDQIHRGWVVLYGLDASVSHGMSQLILLEGKEESGQVAAWSNGIQAAVNAVMIVELPTQVRFTRFFIRNSATTDCSLVDPQHLRCVYNLPPVSSYHDVSYFVVSDVVGVYEASATITLEGDQNPNNDQEQWPITVNAALDVGVRTSMEFPQVLISGGNLAIPFTVFTGSYPISGATARVTAHGNSELLSVSTGAGSCARVDLHEFTCALGDLPGGSTVELMGTVTVTGSTTGSASFGASVSAPGDVIYNNNQISGQFTVAPVGDARVTVASATYTATAGTAFTLPSITVWRQGEIVDGKLTITLPAGVSISSLSGSVSACSGTTTVECGLPSTWPEDQGIQVDFTLLAPVAGNFVVTAKVIAVNDLANANDEATIAVTVNAAPPPNPPSNPPSSPPSNQSSGGGGGRLEWPVALLFGLLLARRHRAAKILRKASMVPAHI